MITVTKPEGEVKRKTIKPIPPWGQIALVSLFSIIGVLTRIGLEQIFLLDKTVTNVPIQRIVHTEQQKSPVYFDFWPNVLGCLLMGFIIK